jgi:2-polyprenyl-6-methoxyphenol hydroxylase-like FAD-dependent oxidoreductase
MAPGRLAPRLGRNGFTPTVVERAPTLRPGGQAVDLRGASRQVGRRMGLLPAVKDVLVPVKGYTLIDSAGRHRVEMPVDAFGGEGLMSEIEVLRGDLSRVFYDATRDDVEYLFDDEITALDEEPDGSRSPSAAARADGSAWWSARTGCTRWCAASRSAPSPTTSIRSAGTWALLH